MKLIKLVWRIIRRIKIFIILLILVLSIVINGTLFLGGSLFGVITNSFEAVTGIQTIASRNKAEIAELSDNLVVERKVKRELKTELAETSGQLVSERKIKRQLKTQVTSISGELVAERQAKSALKSQLTNQTSELAVERTAKRELKTELAETSGQLVSERKIKRQLKTQVTSISSELVVERQAKSALKSQLANQASELAVEQTAKRALQSQVKDLANGLVLFKGKKVALSVAVTKTADQVEKRSLLSATRNVSSMPFEAFPWIGIGVIVSVTILELRDLCETVKDMNELKKAFDPTHDLSKEDLKVCAITVSSKEDIIAEVKASRRRAWGKIKKIFQ